MSDNTTQDTANMASSKAEPSANKQVDQPKEVDDVQQLPKTTPAGMSANPLKTGETGGLPQEHHGDSQDPLKVTDIEDTISRIPRAEPETLTPDEVRDRALPMATKIFKN